MKQEEKRLSKLIEKICYESRIEPILSPGKAKYSKPGDFIQNLPNSERKLLRQSKSKDFQHRLWR